MSRNVRTVALPPSAVWAVLADGWLYPLWVVGASRMRDVDDHWPTVGARLHHSVGVWPLLIDDNTEVLESEPEQLLRLRTRGWPAGEAEVAIRLAAAGAGTEITLDEDAVAGPGSYVPQPLRTPLLAWRNTETLRRLCFVVENRQEDIA
jgi:uncharacterized protein YndB with AHSA1/START domain